ncbi:uncharacterized protein [Argopecten irradians]|uniref:uncharacterized protein n=1 Tax=Argopecten irradians TaxID=31199 RepID=UPI003718EACE
MTSPLIILVASAVITGAFGSLFILLAIAVDTWQEVYYDTSVFSPYTNDNTTSIHITLASSSSSYITYREEQSDGTWIPYYLYNTYSGVWRVCDTLSDAARSELAALGRTKNECYNFVSEYDEESSSLPENGKSIARLQNSAASCFIVSIIDLVAAAGVGVIALTQKQVAACMVTGVLYCMAGLFTVFGLAIFHTKHYYETYMCHALETIPSVACTARVVQINWASPLAWVGVVICVIATVLWLFLTRAIRVIKAKTML